MTVIKLKDLSSAVTFASGDVKKLLKLLLERAGITGDYAKEILKEIINLLAKIKWPNIRDVNFASIIIALYYYFLKNENATLKNIGKKASTKTENSVLTALQKGDGAQLAVRLANDFSYKTRKEILNIICGANNDDTNDNEDTKDLKNENRVWEAKIHNTLEELIARAKKVTKWKINQGLIDDYVKLLNKKIKRKVEKAEKADLEKENENLKKEKEKLYEGLAKRKLRQKRQRTDYDDITDLANIRELERELYREMDDNEKMVHAKQQVKRMLSPHKSMHRLDDWLLNILKVYRTKDTGELKDNIPDGILDILKDYRTKDTEELKRSQEEIARKLNAKKFKSDPRVSENKDKLEKIRKQLGKGKNTMDDFHLNTAKTSDETNNKNRRKSMDATTFAPKSFSAPTIDELKKAKKNLKSVDVDLLKKIRNQRKKFKKDKEEWLKEIDTQKPSIDPAKYKKDSEKIARKRKEILKGTSKA